MCYTMKIILVLLVTVTSLLATIVQTSKRPHIIFILADDLGWNDVGFHGSAQIPTPNIDALAYSGLILQNYYVNPICTPSRSALMTGKYPIHTGMQHTVLYGMEPRGLPLTEKILPQHLKDLGYINRIVGKWHLGSFKKEYTPTFRGFDSHLGYWTGHQDYFDHTAMEDGVWGFDMRENLSLAYDFHGEYSTDLFTKESVRIINQHNTSKPLFLYVAHAAVHSANPYNPLPAPDETVEKFSTIGDYKRRRFAAMLSKLDDSVGAIVDALAKRSMLGNSIIVFSTDNGGPAAGFNLNAASNYPLRGVKNTLWEGGVRGTGLVWSPYIKTSQRVAKQLMHISDWFPTLIVAAGGARDFKYIDGINMWETLSENGNSQRTEILHNIDDIYGNAAVMVGPWKFLQGTTYGGQWDGWYGPSGREFSYNASLVINSPVGLALKTVNESLKIDTVLKLRAAAQINCTKQNKNQNTCNLLKEVCLFNVVDDPCEQNNVASKYPQILKTLKEKLKSYNNTALPPGNLPRDPRAKPRFWNYTFTNFGDYVSPLI